MIFCAFFTLKIVKGTNIDAGVYIHCIYLHKEHTLVREVSLC